MVRVKWHQNALDQLKDIQSYIAKTSPFQARRVVRLIREATRRLEKQPEIGAVVTDWAVRRRIRKVLREIHVFSYRIIYCVQEDNVHIVAVIHAARRLTVEMMGE